MTLSFLWEGCNAFAGEPVQMKGGSRANNLLLASHWACKARYLFMPEPFSICCVARIQHLFCFSTSGCRNLSQRLGQGLATKALAKACFSPSLFLSSFLPSVFLSSFLPFLLSFFLSFFDCFYSLISFLFLFLFLSSLPLCLTLFL